MGAAVFFHLEGSSGGGELVADKRGQVLLDDGAVRREAEAIAASMRLRRCDAWSVIVANEANEWGH
jgi:hypothetical protein